MQKLPLIPLLAGLLLSACSALKNNVVVNEPSDGGLARVRVVMPEEGPYRGVRAYPNSSCTSLQVPGNGMVVNHQMVLGFEKTLNGQKLGMPAGEMATQTGIASAEIRVAANQPITFRHLRATTASTATTGNMQITTTDDGQSCLNALSFTPEANADYELVFGVFDSRIRRCPAQLKLLARNGQILPPVAVETTPATDCKKAPVKKDPAP